MNLTTRILYHVFKFFPKVRDAAGDASSKLYYEELEKEFQYACRDPATTNLNTLYENGSEPEFEQEP